MPRWIGLPLLALSLLGNRAPASQTTAIFGGRVVDGVTGAGIGQATVTLSPVNGPGRSVLTDDSGEFVFQANPGRYLVSARARGYLEASLFQYTNSSFPTPLDLGANEISRGHKVFLWRTAVITGSVMDEHGDPVAGIGVQALRRTMKNGRAALTEGIRARTDDRGTYRLTNLRGGEYVLALPPSIATRSNLKIPLLFYPSSRSAAGAGIVSVEGGSERQGVDFVLPRDTAAHRVSGQVVGLAAAASRPPVVRLIPYESREAPVMAETRKVTAMATGEFSFDDVFPGQYLLYVCHFPGPPLTSGHVDQFSVSPIDELRPPPTDPTHWGEITVSVSDRDVRDVTLQVEAGVRVSGRVRAPGASFLGPPGMAVVLSRVDSRDIGGIPLVRVEADGRFRSAAVPPGQYGISVWLLQFPQWTVSSVEVSGREHLGMPVDLKNDVTDVAVTLTTLKTAIAGQVRDIRTRQVPWAAVYAFATAPSLRHAMQWGPSRLAWTRSDDAGNFSFSTLPPGEYFVVANLSSGATSLGMPEDLDALIGRAERVRLGEGERRQINLTAR
jgi:hypothetical protein